MPAARPHRLLLAEKEASSCDVAGGVPGAQLGARIHDCGQMYDCPHQVVLEARNLRHGCYKHDLVVRPDSHKKR